MENRRIRVFISSTFRDMKADRDALMSHAWPELRRFCRERHVELVEVDMRWGVSEEQSTRKETLKLCLDEIRACRPYFIGLIGERYGWVPGDDAFTEDLKEEQPWIVELHSKSITELEILPVIRRFEGPTDPQCNVSCITWRGIHQKPRLDLVVPSPDSLSKDILQQRIPVQTSLSRLCTDAPGTLLAPVTGSEMNRPELIHSTPRR